MPSSLAIGANISNIELKWLIPKNAERFIPTNLRLGSALNRFR